MDLSCVFELCSPSATLISRYGLSPEDRVTGMVKGAKVWKNMHIFAAVTEEFAVCTCFRNTAAF